MSQRGGVRHSGREAGLGTMEKAGLGTVEEAGLHTEKGEGLGTEEMAGLDTVGFSSAKMAFGLEAFLLWKTVL